MKVLQRVAALLLPRIGRRFPGSVRWLARRAPVPAQVQLLTMLTAHWTGQAISVAAELGLPDRLVSGPRGAAELASELALPRDPLQRLLRALTSAGILTERDDRFALTQLGQLLTGEQVGSLRALARACGGEWFHAWAELRHSIASGGTAFERVYGSGFFDYLETHPESRRTFDEGMRGVSSMTDMPVALAYDFSRFRHVTDVGGGTGTQLATLLDLHGRLQGAVLDRPAVMREAQLRLVASESVRRRLAFVGGDFMDSVPPGSDAYLLKSVLHDWDDETAVRILRNCARQLPREGRVLIVEHVLLDGSQPQFGKLLDLMMLVALGGRERTRREYEVLLAKAGLRVSGEYPTLAEMTLLEAVPAE